MSRPDTAGRHRGHEDTPEVHCPVINLRQSDSTPRRQACGDVDHIIRRQFDIPRPLAHSAALETPLAEHAVAQPANAGFFFDEAEAQRMTLGPRLAHHRHPMTLDEALAGIALFLAFAATAFYLGWRWL